MPRSFTLTGFEALTLPWFSLFIQVTFRVFSYFNLFWFSFYLYHLIAQPNLYFYCQKRSPRLYQPRTNFLNLCT